MDNFSDGVIEGKRVNRERKGQKEEVVKVVEGVEGVEGKALAVYIGVSS